MNAGLGRSSVFVIIIYYLSICLSVCTLSIFASPPCGETIGPSLIRIKTALMEMLFVALKLDLGCRMQVSDEDRNLKGIG